MKQNVVDDYNVLSGQQKAAVLMLSLDEARSSSIFSLMDDEEIKELSVIMASLGKVNSNVIEQLVMEFNDRVSNNDNLIGTYESTENLRRGATGRVRNPSWHRADPRIHECGDLRRYQGCGVCLRSQGFEMSGAAV